MPKKLRSPGQKRKLWIRTAMILLAVITLSAVYFIKGPEQLKAIALVKQHSEAQAAILSLDHSEEEYRTAKGRRRTRDVYTLTYRFALNGTDYQETFPISGSEYRALNGQETLPVWFIEGQPENSEPGLVVENRANESPMENVFDAVPYVAPLFLVLNFILTLLFGREPKGYMPEGFFTDDSWLDIEDDRLVAIDGKELLSIRFDKKNRDDVQSLYQQGGSIDQVLATSKCKQLRIGIDSIVGITSDHFRDTIHVRYMADGKEQSESLEFLNPTVKEHALKRIARALPSTLDMSTTRLTRLQAARPALIFGLIVAAGLYFLSDHFLILAVGVLILLTTVKTLLQRLFNPTVTTTFAIAARAAAPDVSGA